MSTAPKKPNKHAALVLLEGRAGALHDALPTTLRGRMTAAAIVQAVAMAIEKSDALQRCSPKSIYLSVLQATRLGLDVSTGEAYLVPFKGECTLIVGYQGKIAMAMRTGMYSRILAGVCYERDTWELDEASGHLSVRPYLEGDRGRPLFAWARAWVLGQKGEPSFQAILPWVDFEKIKTAASSRTGGKLSPAYKEWPERMAIRSALNRLFKTAPQSRDLLDVIASAQPEERAVMADVIDDDDVPAPRQIAEQAPDFEAQAEERREPEPAPVERDAGDEGMPS